MSSDSSHKHVAASKDPFRFWHMRFWHGMNFSAWIKMFWAYRFAVSARKLPLAVTIGIMSILNSLLRLIQEIVFYGAIRRTKIIHPPIFIVGHWRSGTTLLHELMIQDARFTYANTYQCMAPNHFLLTSWIATRLTFLLPHKRPMDNMAAGWNQPQEDEFALVNLGQVSPYQSIAFPAKPASDSSLTLEGLTDKQKRKWSQALLWFFRRISVQSNKPIIVKSPTHTARIKTLLELFPDARFVFVARNPEHVFGSTLKLWTALRRSQSVQQTDNGDLEEKVLHEFEIMLTVWSRDRHLIPKGHLFETRYEDLVKNPIVEMEKLYDGLGLGDFETMRPRISRYFAQRADYRVDTYAIAPAQREKIRRRWGPLMAPYGYEIDGPDHRISKSQS